MRLTTRFTIYFSFIPSHQGRSAQTINNKHSVKYSAKGFRIGPGLAPSREARGGEDEEAGQGRKRVRARGPPRPRARKPAARGRGNGRRGRGRGRGRGGAALEAARSQAAMMPRRDSLGYHRCSVPPLVLCVCQPRGCVRFFVTNVKPAMRRNLASTARRTRGRLAKGRG